MTDFAKLIEAESAPHVRGRSAIELKLTPIIERHLPTSVQRGYRQFSMLGLEPSPRSHRYAIQIAVAEISGPSRFGFSNAEVTIEEALRPLIEARRLLPGIGPGHRLQLSCELSDGKSWELERFEELLGRIISKLSKMKKEHRKERRASQKPNWRAAAVAGQCRLAWAEENDEIASKEWRALCDGRGANMEHWKRIWDFAPVSQRLKPGPFGRFLEDIYNGLDIKGKDGAVVSSLTGLHSWRELCKQQMQNR